MLDEATDDAKNRILAARMDAAQRRLDEAKQRMTQVQEAVVQLSSRLGEDSGRMTDIYRQLKQRRDDLRRKQAVLDEGLSQLMQIELPQAGNLQVVQRATADK